jgi:hypothetical protein
VNSHLPGPTGSWLPKQPAASKHYPTWERALLGIILNTQPSNRLLFRIVLSIAQSQVGQFLIVISHCLWKKEEQLTCTETTAFDLLYFCLLKDYPGLQAPTDQSSVV